MPISPSRIAAFDTLLGVERGVFSSDLLPRITASITSLDAALAEEIALGVLRWRGAIDTIIGELAGRPTNKLDPEVLAAIRMGVYQLRWLDRIPAHAAINDSVEIVKRARKRSAAGFVNAVLRKVTREPFHWPDEATRFSTPAWILDRWTSHYGADEARRIAEASLQRPERYVRIAAHEYVSEELKWTDVPGAYLDLNGIADDARVQDIGSQSIVPLLDLRPGLTFLDLCSAPGNKTLQALETPVRAIAADCSFRRLAHVRRAGIPLVALDATRPLPFSAKFDRILVDAPCSGTGTLARNPDIKWKLTAADLLDLQKRQIAILRHALDALAPEGILVYSTCSLEPEENERVVQLAGARVKKTMQRIPGRDRGDGFFAAVITF